MPKRRQNSIEKEEAKEEAKCLKKLQKQRLKEIEK